MKIVTPPASEPVNLADFKAWMRGVPVPTSQENMVEMLLAAGREEAEKYQNVSYIEQTLQIASDVTPGAIVLPRPPFKELVSVVCYDEEGTGTDITENFETNGITWPTEIYPKYNFSFSSLKPRKVNPLVITYKAGGAADDVPEKVKQAILLYATWAYMHPGGDLPIPEAFYALLSKGRVIPV